MCWRVESLIKVLPGTAPSAGLAVEFAKRGVQPAIE
jgi:hypothetical protein